MARQILIIKNTPRENPGLIEIVLRQHNLSYQIIDFDHTSIINPIDDYAALIVLGGPESANDLTPKMLSELTLIKKFIQNKIPYLGICLGLQTFVKAMGGIVKKCSTGETGFRDLNGKLFQIKLTNEGRADNLFNNLSDTFIVFQLHGETVQITPDMTLLATGDNCRNQIVKYGETAYGIQSHFELSNELLDSWINEDQELQKVDANILRSDFESLKYDYQNTGYQLFTNFLIIAGLTK